MARLLLLSNATCPGQSNFEWCKYMINDFLDSSTIDITFIPFAAVDLDWDEYKAKVEIGLSQFKIQSLHESNDMIKTINESSVILVGGGNTFHLLYHLQKHNLIPVIRKRVIEDGIPYIGWSAGANVACPDIGTTNDMPIIWPNDGDKALDLFPYNINPHFTEKKIDKHGGESRIKRLNQAFIVKKRSIIGLPEGTGVRIENGKFRFFRTDLSPDDLPIIIKVWRQVVLSDRHEIIDHPMDQLVADWQEIGVYSQFN